MTFNSSARHCVYQRTGLFVCVWYPHIVFTRTWLRYVRVYAIANPSVSVCL